MGICQEFHASRRMIDKKGRKGAKHEFSPKFDALYHAVNLLLEGGIAVQYEPASTQSMRLQKVSSPGHLQQQPLR